VISQERVGFIIHEILDERNLSTKLVPKCLSAGKKCDRVLALQAILDQFWQDPAGFFKNLMTMDETWIHTWRQWFPTFEEAQDTEVIKQGAGVCLLGQRWNFACTLYTSWQSTVALLEKLKQQSVSKHQG
jgi:hypothetical protein